jgi:hypothetical protein
MLISDRRKSCKKVYIKKLQDPEPLYMLLKGENQTILLFMLITSFVNIFLQYFRRLRNLRKIL